MLSLLTFRSRSIDLLAWYVILLFVWSVTAFGQTRQVVLGTQQVEPSLDTVNASTSCPCTIWSPSTTPSTASAADNRAVELGVNFNSSESGFIAGVRFYKGTGNSGTHVGNLWSSTGTLLASVTFTNETATGWQQANFSTPVAITANTTYVVSYFAPVGRYAYNSNYFTSAVTNGPLSALANAGNGVYVYSATSSFPTSTYNATNYWVDVVFETSSNDAPVAVNDSYSSIEGRTLTVAAPGVLSNDSSPSGLSLTAHQLSNPANGTATLNANGSFTYTPNAGFTGSDSFTYQASDGSLNSNFATVTITVNASTSCPCTIWSPSTTPSTASAADNRAVELGVKFNSSESGFIAGVRFYKGAGNIGTHVGNLWSSTGILLASVTFTDETATGWQQANFSTPVAAAANTTYIVSYFAPAGGYAFNGDYFTRAVTNGPLSALANGVNGGNGVYVYSANSSFPTSTYNAANYWVDAVFDVSQPVQVSVSISPTTATISTGAQKQFTASVSGSTNTALTWAASGGTVTSGGLYTAPSSAGTYTVTATSAADSTKAASVVVTVSQTTQVSISISPSTVSLSTGGQEQFTANISGTSNTAVTWSASGGTVSTSGLYVAPSAAGTYTIKVVSAADPTKSASATATVSVAQAISVSVSPTSVAMPQKWQQQFAATVSGSSNTAVTWSVKQGTGTITQSGLYTAPQAVETDVITATSQADSTKSASASVTVVAPHTVSLKWSASTSPNISYYKVYRGTVNGGPYSLLATNVSVTSYTDSSVQSGSNYYYVTTAVDSSGVESGYSDVATAVIPMP